MVSVQIIYFESTLLELGKYVMSHYDYIKEITRFALLNDNKQLKEEVRGLIDYSKKINKHNFALELQSILKESWQKQAVNS